jgi:hypothetical protein
MGSIGMRFATIACLLALGGCSSSKKTTSPTNQAGSTMVGEAGGPQEGPNTCRPGQRRCQGLNVLGCDSSGTSERIEQTCLPSEACVDGECTAAACAPSQQFCQGTAVRQCDSSGRTSRLVQLCDAGLVCTQDAKGAGCSALACQPGAAMCQGSVATTCLSDGSGPKPGGQDCADNAQACFNGQCKDVACTPGTRLCQHGDVYLCAQNGTDLTLWADCQANEVCDGDLGTCRAKLCDPGKAQCDGTRAATCNPYGSAWLPDSRDCAVDGLACASGSCRKLVCAPNASFCQDGDVWSCDSAGATSSLYQTCNSAQHCETYAGGTSAYCRNDDCVPGQEVCSGNLVVTCTDQGTLPASGSSCRVDQYCENGACHDLGCAPGGYFCQMGDVYYCQSNGAPYLIQTCVGDLACKAQNNAAATCEPLACSPGTKACFDNQIGTCAAGGQSLSSVSDDCGASGKLCTADFDCDSSAVDTLGVAESIEVVYAGNLLANAIEVASSRKLSEIQAQLVLASPRELRWVIYELSGSTYVAKYDKLAPSVSGSGFISSGSISYQLVAGKRYLIGVAITGGDAVDYYDTAPYAKNISFGTVIGKVYSSYSSTLDSGNVSGDYALQMKLTTQAP